MDEIRINRIVLSNSMERCGFGVVALSKKAMVDENIVRQMLMGQCPSRIDAAMRVAHALGLMLIDLLLPGGDDVSRSL